MGTVTVYTAAHMKAIEDATVTSMVVNGSGHLIVTRHDGSTFDAGDVSVWLPGRIKSANNLGAGNDPNAFTQNGWYAGTNWANSLLGYTFGIIEVLAYDANYIVQNFYLASNPGRMFTRSMVGGSWTNWIEKNAPATTALAGEVVLASDSDAITGTDTAKAVTPHALKAAFLSVLPLLVADVATLPSAAGFNEGTHIHVDSLNTDFVQKDGVWVQDGVARVADVSTRNTEYAKAAGAYKVDGAQVRVVNMGLTYEYMTTASSGVASNAWYPMSGRLPVWERLISSARTWDGSARLVDWDIVGGIAQNIVSGTDGTVEYSGGDFTFRQPGKWRVVSQLTANNPSATYGNQWMLLTTPNTAYRGTGAASSTTSFTRSVLEVVKVWAAGENFRINSIAGAALSLTPSDNGVTTFITLEYMGPA